MFFDHRIEMKNSATANILSTIKTEPVVAETTATPVADDQRVVMKPGSSSTPHSPTTTTTNTSTTATTRHRRFVSEQLWRSFVCLLHKVSGKSAFFSALIRPVFFLVVGMEICI